MHLLKYKTDSYKNLIFNISDNAPLNAILKCINIVESGISCELQEHIFYSIMELVNNSLRAQKLLNIIDKPIKLKFTTTEKTLIISISDSGGGFDINELPYNILEPVKLIDQQGPSFQAYREKYEYKRFGMGILTARKLFDHFSIAFLNNGVIGDEYLKGKTEGTVITMGVNWDE